MKTKNLLSILVLAAAGLLVSAEQASAQTSRLDWHDTTVTLTASATFLVIGVGVANAVQLSSAKVVIANTSTASRVVECWLNVPNVTQDFALVTLPAGTQTTISLMVAGPQPATAVDTALSCRVTSSGTTGVTAAWVKLTTIRPTGAFVSQQD